MRERKSPPRGSRRRSDDEEPDLFSARLQQVVKQAFADTESARLIPTSETISELSVSPEGESVPAPEARTVDAPPQPTFPNSPATTPASDSTANFSPDVVPARMLNEFVYCPRLFYYEHVEGVFRHNADTVRGAAVHARVDKGNGALPAAGKGDESLIASPDDQSPAEDPLVSPPPDTNTIHSRSVSLGSEKHGVTAKMDLVEAEQDGTGGVVSVCPVDYKAGAPREGEDGNELWPADRMQLGLQMLLLRENGYLCERGIIYYRSTKQRVSLEWTPDLEAWIVKQIAAARSTMCGPIPPPLEGSPKCVRCSLNSVCLPDETRLLGRVTEFAEPPAPSPVPPRRLMTPRDDSRVLYLNTPGTRVGRKDERLVIKDGDKQLDDVRIGDVTHVALFGNIQISTQAIQVLCEREVPVTYFSMGGWFYGITRGHELKNVFTRMEQFKFARDPAICLALARRMVFGKIRNHRTMLMRLHLEPPAPVVAKLRTMADSALEAGSIEELLGTEGAAASFYFSAFDGMLKVEEDEIPGLAPVVDDAPPLRFQFSGRNRRPPTDPVNAMLSLAYSLLAKDCTLAAMAVGLDPYVGFYHQPRFGRPALALDVMEEFRPLIAESAVLTAINNRMILPKHFVQAGSAVNLNAAGRKLFFNAYEQRMASLITHPIFDYKVSYRRVIELQFRLLARFLTGEIPEYPPFLTR